LKNLFLLRFAEKTLIFCKGIFGTLVGDMMDSALNNIQSRIETLEIRNDNENGRDRTVSKSKPNKP
jgi:hypothetical protein